MLVELCETLCTFFGLLSSVLPHFKSIEMLIKSLAISHAVLPHQIDSFQYEVLAMLGWDCYPWLPEEDG